MRKYYYTVSIWWVRGEQRVGSGGDVVDFFGLGGGCDGGVRHPTGA